MNTANRKGGNAQRVLQLAIGDHRGHLGERPQLDTDVLEILRLRTAAGPAIMGHSDVKPGVVQGGIG